MKIGILVCGILPEAISEKHGKYSQLYVDLLCGHSFEFDAFEVVNGQFPVDVNQCDGWLITGSRFGAYEELAWIRKLENFIRDCYQAQVPLTGICFGHQVMARALGGRVEKFEGGWSMGRVNYDFDNQPSPLSLYAMHQDQVIEVPPQARTIASSDFCTNAALAYQGAAISFQPHPEFSKEFMEDLMRHKMEEGLSQELGNTVIDGLAGNIDDAVLSAQIAQFFKHAHSARKPVALAAS